jgi:hypothetical protein
MTRNLVRAVDRKATYHESLMQGEEDSGVQKYAPFSAALGLSIHMTSA